MELGKQQFELVAANSVERFNEIVTQKLNDGWCIISKPIVNNHLHNSYMIGMLKTIYSKPEPTPPSH